MQLPSIEICVTCTWFQKRLCWMLSSILQQEGEVPHIVFNVGYPVNNGSPTTEQVCTFFRGEGLDITEVPFPDMEVIQYRGLARNRQVAASKCDWLLFADTDMTYSSRFFADLGRRLAADLKDERRCISARRVSLAKDHCKDYFNRVDTRTYPCVVDGAGSLDAWPVFQISKNVGAGYFQLIRRDVVMSDLGGIYVPATECADRSWKVGQKARSDSQFRRRCSGLKRISTLPQYHLNHERDNELGYHTTHQR